jgi:DUF971 family protein
MPVKGVLPILGQPDPRMPADVHLVGRYALGVSWADGHSSIYPFDLLRAADEARPEREGGPVPEGGARPRDIRRGADALGVSWADGHESRYPWAELRGRCRCAACTGGH